MPYLQRKNGLVYIYVYQGRGSVKPLPRNKVRHLDQLSDDMVQAWIYTEFGTSPKPTLGLEPDLEKLLKEFLEDLKEQSLSQTTIMQHRSVLLRFGLPFFLEGPELAGELSNWPIKAPRL